MGLDMYLERCQREAWGYRNVDILQVKEDNAELYETIKPYLHVRGSEALKWDSIFEGVGYWRKANAIHRWFVDNVQDGYDDCGYYEVTKEQLEELLGICNTIITEIKMKHGRVTNGSTYANGIWCPNIEEGDVVVNPEIAQELLPTQAGFFFGSTDYDQWYMQNIADTIEILTKTLKETDFNKQMIVYTSSW